MDRNTEVFKQLLDPKFDWSNFDLETIVGLGQEVAANKKIAYSVLGKLAIALEHLPKRTSIKEYAKDIGVAPASLRVYKHVEEQFIGLELPEDISWGAKRVLASQENTKEALKEALEHGLSNPEIVKTFGTKNVRHVICPKCEQEIEI